MAFVSDAASHEPRQSWLRRLLQKPTTHYVLGLLLIACASIASHALLVGSLADLDDDSTVINMSGRQRMLSEQTIRLSGELMMAKSEADIAELRGRLVRSATLMRASHGELLSRMERLSPASGERGALRSAYFGTNAPLDDQLERYFSAIDEVLATDSNAYSPTLPAYRSLAREHRDGLLARLNDVVKLHELQSQERLRRSEQLHVYLTSGALLLLVLEACFIFSPLIRRLTKARDDLVAQNTEMARMAVSDTLTRLPNRSGFGQRLDTLIDAQSGKDRCAAVMMMDLDRFKNVNDTLGHPAGDQVLIEVGSRIQDHLKDVDTVARLGGDEFAIILR
ncbi:MAG: diguanylate cyclase, partial [Pseudomonadota bacterium]